MRHRIKKIPLTLSKLNHKIERYNNHLLHSDESTYFYKGKVKGFSRFVVGSSQNTTSYSAMTGRTVSTIPLVLSSFALLVVLGSMIFPLIPREVHAEEITEDECNSTTKLGLSFINTNVGSEIASLSKSVDDDVTNGAVSTVSQDFNVVACKVFNYQLYVQSDSSLLKNTNAPDALYGVGDKVAETDFSENTWGYNISKADDTSAKTYSTMPDISTSSTVPVAYTQAGSTTNTGQNLTISFAAKFGSNKTAGHYTSEVLLSMVATPKSVINYSITYNGNGGANVPAAQTSSADTDNVKINLQKTTIPTRANFSFRGWSTIQNGEVAYEPGQDVTLDFSQPEVTLYAVWLPVTNKLTTVTNNYMQNMTSAICDQTTTPSKWDTVSGVPTATLTDNRDNSTYAVAKLADGNCWMTQNLRLVGSRTLTSANSDVTSNYSLPASMASPSSWTSTSATANYVYYDSSNPTYGAYYTWYTATAGTGTSSATSGDATGSICPKGWRLPVNGNTTTDKSYSKLLFDAYGLTSSSAGSTAMRSVPLNFVYGGYVSSGSLDGAGGYGRYWSSTVSYAAYVYSLYFISGTVLPSSDSNNRYEGFSVRCVAR